METMSADRDGKSPTSENKIEVRLHLRAAEILPAFWTNCSLGVPNLILDPPEKQR